PAVAPGRGEWPGRRPHPGRAVLAARPVPPRRRDPRRGGARGEIALHAPSARPIHQCDGRSRAAGRPHGRTAPGAGLRGPRARIRRGGVDSPTPGRAHPQAAVTTVAPVTSLARPSASRPPRPAVVLGALVLLLAVYGLLSLANDPRGTLGTDTGGKLATLATMQHKHSLDPDIGYWAEDLDPQGRLHPLWYTDHVGGDWVNVTTLPMLVAASP